MMDITNLSLNSLNNHYAIELARTIVDRCVERQMLTQLQGMLVFDSLVDGLNRRPVSELNDMLLQLHTGNNNKEDNVCPK